MGEGGAPEDEAPAWALTLLDALFTGKTLDFDGQFVPEWLQRRLEREYGFPYPIAQRQPHPDEPGEPDDAPMLMGEFPRLDNRP